MDDICPPAVSLSLLGLNHSLHLSSIFRADKHLLDTVEKILVHAYSGHELAINATSEFEVLF